MLLALALLGVHRGEAGAIGMPGGQILVPCDQFF